MIVKTVKASARTISDKWVKELNHEERVSKKASRDREDREAIGGLRSPHLSVRRSGQAETFKNWLWPKLAKVAPTDAVVDRVFATLGTTDAPNDLLPIAKALRGDLLEELNTGVPDGEALQGALIHGLATRLADLDEPVRQWQLNGAAQLGIDRPIEAGNVFPATTAHGEDNDGDDGRSNVGNYQSYEEHREGAEALQWQKHVARGLVWFPTMTELEQPCGKPVTLSKIVAVAKQKGDQTKLRLIHDLRRFDVNARVVTPERIVLPRVGDAKRNVLDLIDATGTEAWELIVLDFKDALKQIRVHEVDHKHLAGRTLGGMFHCKCITLGVKFGLLIWGRVAALLMRMTPAVMAWQPIRLQCFVGDPLFATNGT